LSRPADPPLALCRVRARIAKWRIVAILGGGGAGRIADDGSVVFTFAMDRGAAPFVR
jgi:hypothetical protein